MVEERALRARLEAEDWIRDARVEVFEVLVWVSGLEVFEVLVVSDLEGLAEGLLVFDGLDGVSLLDIFSKGNPASSKCKPKQCYFNSNPEWN